MKTKNGNSLEDESLNDQKVIDESSKIKSSIPSNSATTNDLPEFGWSAYAERINGRFAMAGFLAVLLVEALSHDAFLHWAGFLKY